MQREVGVRLEYGRVCSCFAVVALAGIVTVLTDGALAEPGHFSAAAIAVKVPLLLATGLFLWRLVPSQKERGEFRAWVGRTLTSAS